MIAYVDASVATRRAAVFSLIASLELVELDATVLDRASQPMPTELGTLDAIHLASAVLWKTMTGADLTMATHDEALGVAAKAHGLPVEPGVTQVRPTFDACPRYDCGRDGSVPGVGVDTAPDGRRPDGR